MTPQSTVGASAQTLYRVIYAAEQRRACFIEVLAGFRTPIDELAQLLEKMSPPNTSLPAPLRGNLPWDWPFRRVLTTLEFQANQLVLDLRTVEGAEQIRTSMASQLARMGLTDFDIAMAQGNNRNLTRAVARFAYEQGYRAIRYRSRLDSTCDCWAIFENARVSILQRAPIAADDADLVDVMTLFGVTLAAAP